MPERFISDRLEQIEESIAAIESYVKLIKTPKDFSEESGKMIFDAIVMRLQVVGENIKALYKVKPEMFVDIENEVTSIVRFRDLISHHYEKLDSEIIYEICLEYIPLIKHRIQAILK